jgi:glycosyltransferase involved in cell wall biosynthesis
MVDPGNFSPVYDANLCRSLAARGHEVVLHTSSFLFEPMLQLDGYNVENDFFTAFRHARRFATSSRKRTAVKGALYPFDLVRWTAKTARAAPEIVHVQWSLAPLVDASIYALLQGRGARVVYTAHNVKPFRGSTWSGIGLSRIYQRADALIVHADESRRQLVETFGVAQSRIHVLPLGGPGAYAGELVRCDEARGRLGLEPNALYGLFFGLIKEHKGLDLALDALALARTERPDLRLLIAGEPMTPWRPYEEQIARLDLASSVDLHLGFVPNERVPLYFGAADLVVLPYREIFQSGVAVAAYTYGRPVVATPVGGLPELVDEGVTGFVAPAADARALADTLVEATADRTRLDEMGDAAALAATGRHSWDEIAARHEQVYLETLSTNVVK